MSHAYLTPLHARGLTIRVKRTFLGFLPPLLVTLGTIAAVASVAALWALVLLSTGHSNGVNVFGPKLSGSIAALTLATLLLGPLIVVPTMIYVSDRGWTQPVRSAKKKKAQDRAVAANEAAKRREASVMKTFIESAEELATLRGLDPLTATVLAHEALETFARG